MAVPSWEDYRDTLLSLDPSRSEDDLKRSWGSWDRAENPRLYQPSFEDFSGALRESPDYAQLSDDELRDRYEAAYPFSTWDAAKAGLGTGAYGVLHSIAGGLEALGFDEIGADLNKTAQAGLRANAPRPGTVSDIVDNPDRLLDTRTWAYGAGSVAPSVAASMIPGGLAFRMAGGMAAIQAGSKIPTLAAGVAGGAAGGALEAGPAYYHALELGMTPEQARAHALKFGVAVGGLNAIPVGQAFSKLGKFGRLGRSVSTGIGEAVTEVAEGPTEAFLLGEDLWEALKAEADVAPGALLAGMLFGAVGNPTEIQRPAPVPEVPPGATTNRPGGTAGPGGLGGPGTVEPFATMLPQQDPVLARVNEFETYNQQLSTDQAFEQAELARQAERRHEEDVAWSRHLAQTEMPVQVRDSLIKSEIERAYQGRAPSQMEQAFRASLPKDLPPASIEAAVRTARDTGILQGTNLEPVDLRPEVAPTQMGEQPTEERMAQLQAMAETGKMPPRRPTMHEERLLNRAQMAMQSGVLPQGLAVKPGKYPDGRPAFHVEQDGKLVATYPTSLGAHTAAEAIGSSAEPVTIVDAQTDERALPFVAPERAKGRALIHERTAIRFKADLAPAEVYAPVPRSMSEVPVGILSRVSNPVVEKLDGQTVNRGTATVYKMTEGQARAMTSLLGTLEGLGVARGALDLIDNFMAVSTYSGTTKGVHMTLSNGQRAIGLSEGLLNSVESGQVTESAYMSAVYTLAHEVGHLVANDLATQSAHFGDLLEEINFAYLLGPAPLQHELRYPMSAMPEWTEAIESGDAENEQYLNRFVRTEAIAQLTAIYYVYGPTMGAEIRSAMPASWALMQEIDRAINTPEAAIRSDRLFAAFRLSPTAVADAQLDLGPIARADYDSVGDGRDTGQAGGRPAGRESDRAPYRGNQLLRPVEYQQLPAWHGTGNTGRYARFDINKVGGEGGEGAQAYGYGLYFTDRQEVAEYYRRQNAAATSVVMLNGEDVSAKYPDIDSYIGPLRKLYREGRQGDADAFAAARDVAARYAWQDYERKNEDAYRFKDDPLAEAAEGLADIAYKTWQLIKNATPDTLKFVKGGSLYKVELTPEPDEYLLWDKPLSEQSEKVKAALEKAGLYSKDVEARLSEIYAEKEALAADRDPVTNRMVEEDRWHALAREQEALERRHNLRMNGEGLYWSVSSMFVNANMGRREASRTASEQLHSVGIRGIKYLDSSSRWKKDATEQEIKHAKEVLEEPNSWDVEEVRMAKRMLEPANYNYVIFSDEDVQIVEHQNDQLPLRHFDENTYRVVSGKRSGMPDDIQTAEDVERLVMEWVHKIDTADEALLNADDWTWYERSADYIRAITHSDPDEMERMARLLAVLSSNQKVRENTFSAVNAAYGLMQHLRSGRPLEEFAPILPHIMGATDMAKRINAILNADEVTSRIHGVAHKVMNFYRNIRDPLFRENHWPDAGTIDRWMYRAFGFPRDKDISPGSSPKDQPDIPPPRYRYAYEVLREITDRYNQTHGTNWLPRQMQAAIWTLELNKEAIDSGKPTLHVDFSTYLRLSTETVTFEAIPSIDSNLDGFLMNIPYDRREAFTQGAIKLLTDSNGRDLLADKIGFPFYGTTQSAGGFEGSVSPNILAGMVAAKTNGNFDRSMIDLYARAVQVIFQQKAVPWHRLDFEMRDAAIKAAAKGDPTGPALSARFKLKGEMSDGVGRNLLSRMAAEGIKNPGYTRLANGEVLVTNFPDDNGVVDQAFMEKINAVAKALTDDGLLLNTDFVGTESDYGHIQDWRGDPAGADARAALEAAAANARWFSAGGRSDLLTWVRDRADAFAEYARAFKQEQQTEGLRIDEVNFDAGPEWSGTQRPDPRYVGSINLEHLRTTEDIEVFLRDGWRDHAEMINQRRREVRDWGTTEAAARTLGMTLEDFLKTPLGQAVNAETLEWSRMVLESQGAVLKKAAQKFMDSPTDLNKVALERERTKLLAIQAIHSGLATEAGRALNILGKTTQSVKDQVEFAKALDNKDLKLEDYALMIAQLEDTGQITAVTRATSEPKLSDKILEVWINFLLSGPQTQATNVMSNTVVSLFSNFEMLVAAGLGAITGSRAVSFGQAGAYASGTLSGAMAGLRAAKRAFITEEGSGEYKIDVRRYQAIEGPMGRMIRVPGRLLLAGDELFKSIARNQMLRMVAMREAEEHVRQHGGSVHERFEQFLAHPTEGMVREVNEWADMQTYTNRLGDFGQALQKMAASHPLMRIVVPFIRTPINIVKFAAKRTPLAALTMLDKNSKLGQELRGLKGKRARDMAWSRVVVGSGIAGLMAQFVAQGLITGGGPDDPKERNAKYADGWQPYSLRIGDKYHSYARMEPLGILLGVTADAVEISEAWTDTDAEDIAVLLVQSVTNNLTSKTFLRGLSELAEALSDPVRYGDRYVQNLAGTVVPTLFSQVARTVDPNLREVRSITDKIKSRVPGESYSLPYRYDILGNAIELEGSAGPDLLSPIYVSTIKNDPVIAAMKSADYYPGMPQKKVAGVELPPAVYADYARLANGTAARTLRAIVETPWFKSLPAAKRADMISDAYTRARRQARDYVLARPENRMLLKQMFELKRQAQYAM